MKRRGCSLLMGHSAVQLPSTHHAFFVSSHPSPAYLTSGNLLTNKWGLLTKWTRCYLLCALVGWGLLPRKDLFFKLICIHAFLFLCTAKQTLDASLKCKKNLKPPSYWQKKHACFSFFLFLATLNVWREFTWTLVTNNSISKWNISQRVYNYLKITPLNIHLSSFTLPLKILQCIVFSPNVKIFLP